MTENKTIFEFADKFAFESPLGDWLDSDDSNKRMKKVYSFRSTLPKISNLPSFSKSKTEDIFCKLGIDKESKSYYLFDFSGIVSRYDTIDNSYDASLVNKCIILPSGTRVAKIGKCHFDSNNYYYVIILFWKGRYREGLVANEAIQKTPYNDINTNSFELFINDIERILYECKIRNSEFSKNIHYKSVKNKIYAIKGNKKISNKFPDIVRKYYKSEMFATDANFMTAYEKSIKFIKIKLGKHIESNNVIILPLLQDWFDKNENINGMKDFISRIKKFELYDEINNSNTSGLVIHKSKQSATEDINCIDDVVKYLLELTGIIKNDTILSDSPEGVWMITYHDKIKSLPEINGTIITLGGGIWRLKTWTNYAGLVGVQNAFGPIYFSPLNTILIHELDQDPLNLYLPGDSHIYPELTDKVIDEICSNPPYHFTKNVLFQGPDSDKYKSDFLFQCSTSIGLVSIDIFLDKYMNNN